MAKYKKGDKILFNGALGDKHMRYNATTVGKIYEIVDIKQEFGELAYIYKGDNGACYAWRPHRLGATDDFTLVSASQDDATAIHGEIRKGMYIKFKGATDDYDVRYGDTTKDEWYEIRRVVRLPSGAVEHVQFLDDVGDEVSWYVSNYAEMYHFTFNDAVKEIAAVVPIKDDKLYTKHTVQDLYTQLDQALMTKDKQWFDELTKQIMEMEGAV